MAGSHISRDSVCAAVSLPCSVSHEGDYQCRADNGHHSLEHTLTLTVLSPPSISGLNSVTTVQGEYSLALHCTAHGKPRPSIHWAKLGNRSATRG